MKLMTAAIILAIVGALSVALLWAFNRRPLAHSRAARLQLLSQARERPDADIDAFLRECGIDGDHSVGAERVLGAISALLEVPISKVAADVEMSRLFSIAPPPGQSGQIQEPFAFELVERLSEICDKEQLAAYVRSLPNNMRGDDAIASILMGMTVPEMVRTFAPLANK